jgi:hypothetical protein
VHALNLTHSPENTEVWESADRFGLPFKAGQSGIGPVL